MEFLKNERSINFDKIDAIESDKLFDFDTKKALF